MCQLSVSPAAFLSVNPKMAPPCLMASLRSASLAVSAELMASNAAEEGNLSIARLRVSFDPLAPWFAHVGGMLECCARADTYRMRETSLRNTKSRLGDTCAWGIELKRLRDEATSRTRMEDVGKLFCYVGSNTSWCETRGWARAFIKNPPGKSDPMTPYRGRFPPAYLRRAAFPPRAAPTSQACERAAQTPAAARRPVGRINPPDSPLWGFLLPFGGELPRGSWAYISSARAAWRGGRTALPHTRASPEH